MEQTTADHLWHSPSLPARFWKKLERAETGCWLWSGCLVDGYGRIRFGDSLHLTHRVAYETLVGPIPDELVIDHLCRTRNCANPTHLEPVTRRTNTLRGETLAAANAAKERCPQGHEYTHGRAWGKQRRWCNPCRRKPAQERAA